MNKRNRYLILLLVLCASVLLEVKAQNYEKACHHDMEMSRLDRLEWAAKMNQWKNSRKSVEIKTIPVVVHVINQGEASRAELNLDRNVSNFISQINQAFAHSGIYADDTIGVDTRIQFCLAKTSPDGAVTNGYTYTESYYDQFDMDMETDRLIGIKQWDPEYYLNIWLVTGVDGESVALYNGRSGWFRLGVAGLGGDFGIIVTSINPALLVHEIGHYLSLFHTFSGGCKNDNCEIDGDMVCDTPPDNNPKQGSVGEFKSSCGDNSCQTDTLSNFSNGHFFEDVPDMGSNFMDYFNGECVNNFSQGQADRMHFDIENNKVNLINPDFPRCVVPCEMAERDFNLYHSKELISEGDTVYFSSTFIDGFSYEWYVEHVGYGPYNEYDNLPYQYMPESASLGSGSTLSYNFVESGRYRVYVKAYENGSDGSCFVSDHRIVIVNCGLDARFVPNKRIIASKLPVARFTDSVAYVNRTEGPATDFQWTITYSGPEGDSNPVDSVFHAHQIEYRFPEPGYYHTSLSVSNETCENTSPTWTLIVLDPTIDGIPTLSDSSICYDSGMMLDIEIFNDGFDTINVDTPVSIYGSDIEGNTELIHTYLLDEIVYGFEAEYYTVEVEGDFTKLTEIHAVFNDTGSVNIPTFPPGDSMVLSYNAVYPPSGILELRYSNNQSNLYYSTMDLYDLMACEEDKIFLEVAGRDSVIWWSSNDGLISTTSLFDYEVLRTDSIFVTALDSGYCIVRDTFNITVSIPELTVADSVYAIFEGEEVTLQANGANFYNWSPSRGLSNPTSPTPIASPVETTFYQVIGLDTLGCTDSEDVTVYVMRGGFIPTLFTPNSDRNNDFLTIYGLKDVEKINFEIFNNQNQLVYKSDDPNFRWYGEIDNNPLPAGLYYWTVSGKYIYGRDVLINGTNKGVIHLVRP